LSKDNQSATYDVFHIHEAQDRTFLLSESLEMALGEHPVILQDKRSNALYQEAVKKLAELYQHIGNISANDA